MKEDRASGLGTRIALKTEWIRKTSLISWYLNRELKETWEQGLMLMSWEEPSRQGGQSVKGPEVESIAVGAVMLV